jgi:predicted GIY-YIG superfamily endonuclease
MNAEWWVNSCEKRGGIYVGVTTDLMYRLAQHGRVKPLYQEGPMSKAEAVRRERQFKGWKREKKQSLYKNGSEKLM